MEEAQMKKIIITLSLIATLFPINLYAKLEKTTKSECSPIDIRNSSLGAPRNQHEVSWCYAFAASDLLDFYYPKNEKISAADMATRYNTHGIARVMKFFIDIFSRISGTERYRLQHMTGFSKIALEMALENGSCPESVFPSESWVKVQNGQRSNVPLKQAMLDVFTIRKEILKGMKLAQLPFHYEFENVSRERFYNIVKSNIKNRIFNKFRLAACENKRESYAVAPEVIMKIRNSKIFKKIDEKLSANEPALIDYVALVLLDHTNSKFSVDELHTSILVGRQWNDQTNSCEYLIRNSYGESCEKYDPSLKCENGHLWVSQDDIYRNMTSTVYLKH
jgi:hypothetical protein